MSAAVRKVDLQVPGSPSSPNGYGTNGHSSSNGNSSSNGKSSSSTSNGKSTSSSSSSSSHRINGLSSDQKDPVRAVVDDSQGSLSHHLAAALRFASLALASRLLLRVMARWLPDSFQRIGLGAAVTSAEDNSWDLLVAIALHIAAASLALSRERRLPNSEALRFASETWDFSRVDVEPLVKEEVQQEPSEHFDNPRSCGFQCMGPRQGSVDSFAPRLQRLLDECRRVRNDGAIFRIFDDCTVEHTTPGGARMELTETRCSPFRRLRECSGLTEDQYFSSMCAKPFSGGTVEVSGKSGSIFLRTHDNRLVLKTIEPHEFEVLKQIIPHMLLYLEHHPKSLLCRFFGAYALTIDRTTLRFVVMANMLPRKPEKVYDLKGTTEDRWVDPKLGGVLKDLNFKNYTMQFDPQVRSEIVQSLCDDADFLESLGTMDYSLLVGLCPPSRPLDSDQSRFSTIRRGLLVSSTGDEEEVDFEMGVIDYLQQWTSKKVVAHWLKKATLGCVHEIDTEPPRVYCQRFSAFFTRKILSKK